MRIPVIGLISMGKRRVRNLQFLHAGEIIGFDLRADRRAEAEVKYGIKTVEEAQRGFSSRPDQVNSIAKRSLARAKRW